MGDLLTQHSAATDERDDEKLIHVLDGYNDLLNQFHSDPTLLFSIATIFLQRGWHGLSINLFIHLLDRLEEADHAPQLWNNLGTAYKGEHIDDKARECWEKALSMVDPESGLAAEYHSNLATLEINNGTPEAGYVHIKESTRIQPENTKSWWNRSLLELELCDYEQGFANYEYGIQTGDRMNRWKQIPYYEGQILQGKRVLVYGEQGVGDEIMFASALGELVDAVTFQGNVVYECHDRLESLMKRTFPEVDVYPTRKEKEDKTIINPESFDYRLGIGSLFRWFGVKKRKPYLIPDPELLDLYQEKLRKLGDGLKVGIGYAGGHKKTHAHTRSFKLSTLGPILDVDDCTFVSLQYTDEATAKFSNHFLQTGRKVHHWPDAIYRSSDTGFNFDHTVALIAALDVCILPNTTAVHVCGAVGTDCISLTPDACAWRYRGEEEHMIMYEDHVLLARQHDGKWDMPIGDTTLRLVKKAHG